jgi:hypothetical protein
MKKPSEEVREDEMRPEYDAELIKSGVRGKYADRYQAGTNLALLEPDVAEAFPDDEAVNEALRMLIKVADASVEKRRRRRPTARSK